MNHGAIGLFEESIGLWLPEDVLRPISIGDGTKVYGLYYPKWESYPESVQPLHDFMLTPVPPNLWCSLGRFTIRIQHESHKLEKISSVIREHNASILCGECSRSGHRYATYTLIICFEDRICSYDDDTNKYRKEGNLNESDIPHLITEQTDVIREKCDLLANKLKNKCSDALFCDKVDPELLEPIEKQPLTALPYFYYTSIARRIHSEKRMGFIHKPFQLVNRSGFLQDGNSFKDIVRFGQKDNQLGAMSPSCAFVSMDSRNVNLRIAIIPAKIKNSFVEVVVRYEREAPGVSSRGLLYYILKKLPPGYNLYHVVNHSSRNDKTFEEGEIKLFLHDTSSKDQNITITKTVKDLLQSHVGGRLPDDINHINITGINVYPMLTPGAIDTLEKRRKNKGPFTYDVFISYSAKDDKPVQEIEIKLNNHGISCFLARKEIKSGVRWSNEIRKAIHESQEMCIVCSNNSVESKWVQIEWGAAWALDRIITPLILNDINQDRLPPWFSTYHARTIDELDKYAMDIIARCHRPWS